MQRLTPTVLEGLFGYQDGFYAISKTPDHSYKRATPANIAHSLRDDSPPQSPHFWRAQLIHYGLQVTSHVDLAKHRLATALELNGLDVPPGILRIESRLRRL